MDFVSNQEQQVKEMLSAIGVRSFDDLITGIPKELRMTAPTEDDGLSEYEGMELMKKLAALNSYTDLENYMGGGAYEHHSPACVAPICQKSEFLTTYTPYQAECSQGMLQTIFEFQSAVCAVTGLDVSNASLYDGASACAEAVLMALRHGRKRKKILLAASLHPHYRKLVDQYLSMLDVELITLPSAANGCVDLDQAHQLLQDDVAGLLVQSPNFFGRMESLEALFAAAREKGILNILCANPVAFGLFKSPGELGADISVGDMQPFGLSLSFGGPYVGYIACTQNLVRQMPGRIVGETIDVRGERGFVLTLQAREQHIRREKATSNICSNQALAALATLITTLWYGREGVKELALANYQKANYLRQALSKIPGVEVEQDALIFNEFVVHWPKPMKEVQAAFLEHGIALGIDLELFDSAYAQHSLVCVTETKSKEQLDRYVSVAKEVMQ